MVSFVPQDSLSNEEDEPPLLEEEGKKEEESRVFLETSTYSSSLVNPFYSPSASLENYLVAEEPSPPEPEEALPSFYQLPDFSQDDYVLELIPAFSEEDSILGSEEVPDLAASTIEYLISTSLSLEEDLLYMSTEDDEDTNKILKSYLASLAKRAASAGVDSYFLSLKPLSSDYRF